MDPTTGRATTYTRSQGREEDRCYAHLTSLRVDRVDDDVMCDNVLSPHKATHGWLGFEPRSRTSKAFDDINRNRG